VKELARRAGVTRTLFQSWKIDVSPGYTTVHLTPGMPKFIAFRHSFSPCVSRELLSPASVSLHAPWMHLPGQDIRTLMPDLIVPDHEQRENGTVPLFREKSPGQIECFADLPALTVITLARAEEVQARRVDVHGRFCAEDSIALQSGFLDRPIVDEWG